MEQTFNRVIIASDVVGSKIGGIEVVANTLTRGFLDRGISVERISVIGEKIPEYDIDVPVLNLGKNRSKTTYNKASEGASGFFNVAKHIIRAVYTPIWKTGVYMKCIKYLNSLGSKDVVVLFSMPSMGYFVPALKIMKYKKNRPLVIGQHHNRFGAYFDGEFDYHNIINKCDKFLVLSHGDAKLFAEEFGVDVGVMNNPIDMSDAQPGLEKNNVAIVVSRLSPEKNIDSIIRAFDIVARDAPGWELHIHGSGPEEESLKELIESLDNPSILFKGPIYHQDKWEALGRAKLALMNSDFEGLPMFMIEALASGTPVISSPSAPGVEEVLHNVGYLTEDTSVDELVEKITQAIANPDELEDKAQASVEKSKEFEISTVLDAWGRLIDSLNTERFGQ
ncbi:MAG: glycosyltransferase [Rothia sp. (in: high G+C Gram-positive bacteria)]|uniref:glycosyltransferase n=1 Tax=Rothia sp. (in: high G+C Gram-positive bacteria) TaxID=1885016 RepID=UPI0026DECE99|nr:glycosyltransferase [Rothia sp. (in: high G+C Gram-positive bacteria)]MDO5750265.1 glycosyltransferase [Rothia sp. (in: high G+C Gram-positive bacteria)]